MQDIYFWISDTAPPEMKHFHYKDFEAFGLTTYGKSGKAAA